MENIVFVPIHLDALFLDQQQLVSAPMADFGKLPYFDGEKDRNPDTANLSESVLSIPFQSQNLNLSPGVHLHWSLPDALTKGGAGGTVNDYPAVPNRWLITRRENNGITRQWVVESDYLHPEGAINSHNSIAYPIDTPSGQPFRYMGRQLDYNGWQEDPVADRLSRLTVIGYGEPSFAAFYPNCHSVFGGFDEEITSQNQLQNLSYQLIGWYSDPAKDPFLSLLTDNPGDDQATLEEKIKIQFGWACTIDTGNLPQGICCHAELTFNAGGSIENTTKHQPVTIAMANTGTEALSAWLANALPGNKSQLEEQLESLLLQTQLQNKSLDLGPRFKESRHEKGFTAESGGSLWEIRPANTDNKAEVTAISLPPAATDALATLNNRQRQLNNSLEKLKDERQILFADWYKYMLCAYPPDDTRDDYPDIDLVKYNIEQKRLPQLQDNSAAFQAIQNETNDAKNTLQQQISDFNNSTISKAIVSKPLNTDTADTSGLNLNNTTWQDNAPFSGQCLSLNGSDAYISISGLTDVKAISMWVNIATQQQSADAALLAGTTSGTWIGRTETTDFWSRIAINGKDHPAYKTLTWNDLPKDRWTHLYIEFNEPQNETLYLFANAGAQCMQGKLAAVRIFNEALTTDELHTDQNMLGHREYQLKEVTGPRFWKPAEPVVLLEGVSVAPSLRHGQDGRLSEAGTLTCQIATIANYPLQDADFSMLLSEINNLRPAAEEEKIGYDTWTVQPWHPFLMEWEAELFPMQQGGNLDATNRNFDPGFISANFELPENSPELTVKTGKSTIEAAAIYSGRTILTPYARTQFTRSITTQLNNLTQEESYQALSPIPDEDTTAYNDQLAVWYATKPAQDSAAPAYETWYLGKPIYNSGIQPFSTLAEPERFNDFNYTLIQTYKELTTANKHLVSQSLGGFNNALLMHHQTLQLPVADPLGFEDYQIFTNKVKNAIAGNSNLAPAPLNDFLPIRSGTMKLHRLHIIDTFGQLKKDVSVTNIIKSEVVDNDMTSASDEIWLPPRFVQPACLGFRWLSADSTATELHTHPESSPVCGWLLANHLDNSLAVYEPSGVAIGSIDQEAVWRAVPGTDAAVDPLDISNPHLRKVVQQLAVTNDADNPVAKQSFLQNFITVTDRALENIDPEAFEHHQELSILMGRPIAVVRASVNISLKGDPAIHHGWHAFRRDLLRTPRETDGFEAVKIPIRIGERGQLNDGTLGYWKEDGQQQLGDTFYTTIAPGLISNDNIKSYEEAPLSVSHSLNDTAETLTLLIDPRGEVHATTGLLPAKSIDIPRDQYAAALKKINITFLSAPVLMEAQQTALPLPNEPGYEWSWLQKKRFQWKEVARSGILRKDTLITTFENGADIWQELLDKGWIHETDSNRATIIPIDQRTAKDLSPPYHSQADRIQQLLDQSHILPLSNGAVFSNTTRIKEGWLKLSSMKN